MSGNKKKQVLLIEDEKDYSEPLIEALRKKGYEVTHVQTMGEALQYMGFGVEGDKRGIHSIKSESASFSFIISDNNVFNLLRLGTLEKLFAEIADKPPLMAEVFTKIAAIQEAKLPPVFMMSQYDVLFKNRPGFIADIYRKDSDPRTWMRTGADGLVQKIENYFERSVQVEKPSISADDNSHRKPWQQRLERLLCWRR